MFFSSGEPRNKQYSTDFSSLIFSGRGTLKRKDVFFWGFSCQKKCFGVVILEYFSFLVSCDKIQPNETIDKPIQLSFGDGLKNL
jgi:hypothetical protein